MLLRICLLLALAGLAAPAAARADFRARAVSWAIDHAGHRERGTTNCSKMIVRWERDMGLRVPPCRPWCGAFVHQAFLRAGVRLSARLIDPDRVYADALAGRRKLRRIAPADLRAGDIVLFRFRAGVRASHAGIVRGRPRGGRVATAEGNVAHRSLLTTRPLRTVVMAVRVIP